MKFSTQKLSKSTLKALAAMSFSEMTPIQEKAIPVLLRGQDIIGQADTGTGKTAAFAIPTIENLDPEAQHIQTLVLCPTRELCTQVTQQFAELMKFHKGFKSLAIYGGQRMGIQLRGIKAKPQVIVGTPGRVLDHIKRGSLKLRAVKTVILDEADKMLSMGFKDDIEDILHSCRQRKQTVLFSATMQPDILKLARKHQNKAEHINVKKKKDSKVNIKQTYYKVDHKIKPEAIKRLLAAHQIKSSLIFCNTKIQVDRLSNALGEEGFSVAKIHGDIKQNKREAVMRKFKSGDTRILVATDVAARGIDVDDIGAVFNYNLPRDTEDYVHRIGRTGRAGKTGLAFTLASNKELHDLKRIANKHKLKMDKEIIPSLKDLTFSSVLALENALIDSTLSQKARKRQLKRIREIQEDVSEDREVISHYFKDLDKQKGNIFGACFK